MTRASTVEIRFENVTYGYGDALVLREISATLESGSTTVIVGPSGCGKTTFLRLINGLNRPLAGTVSLAGQPLDYGQIDRTRRGMGYVMQESGLFPHMSTQDNVALIARLEGWSEDKIDQRAEELFQLVNLPDAEMRGRYPTRLSGGQRQRVAIARALMLHPQILLMDEPFSSLDPIVRRELQDEFVRLKDIIHRTIVFVTHDFAEAYHIGDRIILLDGGAIDRDAAPKEFVADPRTKLAKAFVDSARGLS